MEIRSKAACTAALIDFDLSIPETAWEFGAGLTATDTLGEVRARVSSTVCTDAAEVAIDATADALDAEAAMRLSTSVIVGIKVFVDAPVVGTVFSGVAAVTWMGVDAAVEVEEVEAGADGADAADGSDGAGLLDEGSGDEVVGFWVDVAVGEGAGELGVEAGADGAFVDEGALVSVVLDGEGEAVGAWVGSVAVELVGDGVAEGEGEGEGEEAFVGAGVDVLVGVGAGAAEVVGEVAGEEDTGVEDVGTVEEPDVGAEVVEEGDVEGAGAAVGVVEDVGAVVLVGEVGEVGVDDWLACTP
ncbi:hypothetical protein ACP4J4_01640 [Aureimonas ureilytica]|uniref:hypothetical protein n=1 Tax=Aureimonas ureilytica TaxID=401562 RepID=UPI003CEF8A96